MDRAISYKSAAYWMIPLQSSNRARWQNRAPTTGSAEVASSLGSLKWKHDSVENVITHPYPVDHAAVRSCAGAARASRMVARALRPARRPVVTIEQRSA